MFSATRIVPSISARTIDKIDCTQAINPALKMVVLEKTQIKGGIKVIFHRVEFSDKSTRVYLTVENLNRKTSIGSMTLMQKPYKAKNNTQQPTHMMSHILSIPPGIEENGVILFEPLNYKTQATARLQFEATKQDTYDSFDYFPRKNTKLVLPKY